MFRILLSVIVFLHLFSVAQLKELSPAMVWKLSAYDDSEFPVFIAFEEGGLLEMVEQRLGQEIGRVGVYALINTDRQRLLKMVELGLCSYVGVDWDSGRPLNDQMILNNNIFPLHQGINPLTSSLKGDGIVMGLVDSGVEVDHPDFQHEDGSTRILKLWDQLFLFDEAHIPEDFGWGTEWSSEEIDSDLATHVDQPQWFGHGSTVTGTACGDGSALNEFVGVAPNSDMVIVSFDFSRPGFRANVASSVQYVFDVADALDKPAVVNLSLGSYFGSHDGLDPAALYIDSLLEAEPGRLAVAAIGNSNHLDPYHLKVELVEDTSFTWFEVESNLFLGSPGAYFELWADTADFDQIEFTMGADKIIGSYENRGSSDWLHYTDLLGQVTVEEIVNGEDEVLGSVQYWGQLRGEQLQIQALVLEPDSADYAYRFMTKGTGTFDIWSTSTFGTSDMIPSEDIPSSDEFPEIVKYNAPDRLQHMVDSWTCSDKVISVANYTNRVSYTNYLNEITTIDGTQGDIYLTSSAGPTRDGRIKPDIAATGSTTLSTGNFAMLGSLIANEPHKVAPGGMHFRNGGSSMASPVVAGVGALFLEQCPEAGWEDFKSALYATAAIDGYTAEVPNPRWGMGKLNGYGTVAYASIEAVISQVGDSLFSSGGVAYQWFLDGIAIEGMTQPYLIAQEDGNYQVQVFDEIGCSGFSSEALYTGLDEVLISALEIYPNPTKGIVHFRGIADWEVVGLWDSYGRDIGLESRWIESDRLDISDLAKGIYFFQVRSDSQFRSIRLIKE